MDQTQGDASNAHVLSTFSTYIDPQSLRKNELQ